MMMTTRKRALAPDTSSSAAVGCGGSTVSCYEKSRSERIKENMERMKKFGILDLSLKLKSECRRSSPARANPGHSPRARNSSTAVKPPFPLPPPRRSNRLQSVAPISYSEFQKARNEKLLADDSADWFREGSKEEVYTEEHEKLLGSCQASWTFFVDGYDNSGKRIYDQVKGMTCHQCRQKTLGHRTNCSKCNLVQGQFCGDCLYMRYGENVLEVKKNPSWICPVCRGICNCSLCRVKKGWAPTGPFYKKIRGLGYKSVAHFLILTRRGQSADNGSVEPNSLKEPQSSTDTEFTDRSDTCGATVKEFDQIDENSSNNIGLTDVWHAGDDITVVSNAGGGEDVDLVVKSMPSAS